MHQKLLSVFRHIAPIEEAEELLITKYFITLSLKKGEFFLQSGEVNKYIGFINKGLVRYFVYKNDDESTFEFTAEGEFIGDYQSFRNYTPSVQNIQAVEDCELLAITNHDVQQIFNNTPHGNLLGRMIMEHRFDVMVNQLLAVYMQNHEERYKNFTNNYTAINQRIPQYMVASYVGVKPESLSRIRKRFMK